MAKDGYLGKIQNAGAQEVKAPNLSKKGGKTVVKKGDDLRK